MVSDNMNILILGATGTLGTALTKRLFEETNHHLALFSRHADESKFNDYRITKIKGDALNEDELLNTLINQDIVVCAISGAGLPKIALLLAKLMKDNITNRLIFIGAIGIYDEIPSEVDEKDNLKNNKDKIPNRESCDTI